MLSLLQERLGDLKTMRKRKYGLDVESEDGKEDEILLVDADGTEWEGLRVRAC